MAKTNAPAKVHVKAGEEPFSANARPDPYDLRDLEYATDFYTHLAKEMLG